MRTRVNAVETESAVEVSGLARLKQRQLTAALNHHQRRRRLALPANAVFRVARGANALVTHLHFQRRNRRSDKVKLPDRAHKLAERRMLENAVDNQRDEKIETDDQRRPPRRRPQIEQLVNK